jgi:hypothetical protein
MGYDPDLDLDQHQNKSDSNPDLDWHQNDVDPQQWYRYVFFVDSFLVLNDVIRLVVTAFPRTQVLSEYFKRPEVFFGILTKYLHVTIFMKTVFRIWIVSGCNQASGSFSSYLDPGPGGQKWPTKISCFEALDVLFWGLKASPVAWTSFMEA